MILEAIAIAGLFVVLGTILVSTVRRELLAGSPPDVPAEDIP